MALPLKFTAETTQVGCVKLVPAGLSTITAQLRHWAAPQPNFVPVKPRNSRKKSFIVRSSYTSIGPYARPLIVMASVVTRALPSACSGSPASIGNDDRWHRRWHSAAPERRESSQLPPCPLALRSHRLVAAPRPQDRATADRTRGRSHIVQDSIARCRARLRKAGATRARPDRRPSRSRLAPAQERFPAPAPCRIQTRCRPWRCAVRRWRERSRRGPTWRTLLRKKCRNGCCRWAEILRRCD